MCKQTFVEITSLLSVGPVIGAIETEISATCESSFLGKADTLPRVWMCMFYTAFLM